MNDPLARRLASAALGVGLLALVIAGWAVRLGYRYLEEVQQVGQTVETLLSASSRAPDMPLNPPPLQLDTGEE